MRNEIKMFCPVCGHPSDRDPMQRGHSTEIDCDRCGQFAISDSCLPMLGDPQLNNGILNSETKKASVGFWLRQQQRHKHLPKLLSHTIEKLAEAPWFLPLQDQLEQLVMWIGEKEGQPGERASLNTYIDQFAIGARTPSGIVVLVEKLQSDGLIEATGHSAGPNTIAYTLSLTFNGWLAFEDLQSGKTRGRTAFMAMPFNKPDLEQHWLPELRTAVGETGFTLKRVDDEPRPGLIDVRMRVQIKEARFLIVELTHANQGAYWEAGFAEGLGKPVIYTCRKDEQPHFDVDHSLRIEWNPENLADALSLVKATIRNELPDAAPAPDDAE